MQVQQLMSQRAVCMQPDDDLCRAHLIMRRGGFRHLPVVEGGEVVGMLSDRDVLRLGVPRADGLFVGLHRVRDAMTKGIVTCRPEDRVGDAIDEMLRLRIDAVVVVGAAGEVHGILTSTDLLGALRRREGVTDIGAVLEARD